MTVKAILEDKGREVITIAPERKLSEAVKLMAERRIGAVVVARGEGRVAGILSERDVVRALAETGADALDRPVSSAMTVNVRMCREQHTVNEVMEIMTHGRFRHLPVEQEGRLAGLVSIGDVVKRRIEDVEREAEQIREYIATA
jgi:CBS domain-containing protein